MMSSAGAPKAWGMSQNVIFLCRRSSGPPGGGRAGATGLSGVDTRPEIRLQIAMVRLPKILPVFALPSVVLFPKTYLPLHIFEPRYREMVRDSLNGSQAIVMSLLKEGWERNYYGHPEVFSLGCVGRIVKSQTLEDGRYNILLYGLAKVRLRDDVLDKSYRRARIETVRPPSSEGLLPEELRSRLLRKLRAYGELVGTRPRMEMIFRERVEDEALVNLFSAEINFTVVEKQFLLEAENLMQQCKRLIELLRFRIDEVRRGRATG